MTTEHRLSPPCGRMTRWTNLTIRKSGDVRRADGRVMFAVVTRVEPTWCIVVFERLANADVCAVQVTSGLGDECTAERAAGGAMIGAHLPTLHREV